MGCAAVYVGQAAADLGSVALLYGVVAVQAALFAIGNPARNAMIPRLIGLDLLPAANALGIFAFTIGSTVGPVLGGFLIGATGTSMWVYALDLVAYGGMAYAMWRLAPMPPVDSAPRTAGWASVREGLAFLKGRTNLQIGRAHV